MSLVIRRTASYESAQMSGASSKRKTLDARLVLALKEIRGKHPCYGVQSMLDELPERLKVSYGKGYAVCRDHGLLTKRRNPGSITRSDPKAEKAEDLVNRDFTADQPGTKVFTDITEMRCSDGKLYFCGVLDAFDGAQVGYSMDDNMRASLCTSALLNAKRRYGLARDCIVHSDHGSQFTSHLYRKTLAAQGMRQSMGSTGCVYDNARAESFFATLKKEHIYRLPIYRMTKTEVKQQIFVWIESYYNKLRRNTANEQNLPPLRKHEAYYRLRQAA